MYGKNGLSMGIILIGMLALVLAGCPAPNVSDSGGPPGAAPTEGQPPSPPPPVDRIKWWTDFGAAQREAKDFKQPLVVDFGAEWCGWCKKLEQETFPAAEVQALKDKFVWARIDTDATPEPAKQFEVEGLPTIVVLSPEGKLLARQEGFLPAAEMVVFLKGALEKAS